MEKGERTGGKRTLPKISARFQSHLALLGTTCYSINNWKQLGGEKAVASSGRNVRGGLVRWARAQQGLTMRWIASHGGPSPGYQSEIEQGKKAEVRPDLLSTWVRLLHVTETFARGELPRYHENPSACRGLAREAAIWATSESRDVPHWPALNPMDRVRTVLRVIPRECQHLPRVVLAYILGMSVRTLDDLILGSHPVMKGHLQAVSDLTTLSVLFFSHGVTHPEAESAGALPCDLPADSPGPEQPSATLQELLELQTFMPALRLAQRAGITPGHLHELIEQWTKEPQMATSRIR